VLLCVCVVFQVFHDVAYKARDRYDLLAGIDEFLDCVTVLPPGEWDPTIRIEPPKSVPSQVDGLNLPTAVICLFRWLDLDGQFASLALSSHDCIFASTVCLMFSRSRHGRFTYGRTGRPFPSIDRK